MGYYVCVAEIVSCGRVIGVIRVRGNGGFGISQFVFVKDEMCEKSYGDFAKLLD